jgi:hypothetical protein
MAGTERQRGGAWDAGGVAADTHAAGAGGGGQELEADTGGDGAGRVSAYWGNSI